MGKVQGTLQLLLSLLPTHSQLFLNCRVGPASSVCCSAQSRNSVSVAADRHCLTAAACRCFPLANLDLKYSAANFVRERSSLAESHSCGSTFNRASHSVWERFAHSGETLVEEEAAVSRGASTRVRRSAAFVLAGGRRRGTRRLSNGVRMNRRRPIIVSTYHQNENGLYFRFFCCCCCWKCP